MNSWPKFVHNFFHYHFAKRNEFKSDPVCVLESSDCGFFPSTGALEMFKLHAHISSSMHPLMFASSSDYIYIDEKGKRVTERGECLNYVWQIITQEREKIGWYIGISRIGAALGCLQWEHEAVSEEYFESCDSKGCTFRGRFTSTIAADEPFRFSPWCSRHTASQLQWCLLLFCVTLNSIIRHNGTDNCDLCMKIHLYWPSSVLRTCTQFHDGFVYLLN